MTPRISLPSRTLLTFEGSTGTRKEDGPTGLSNEAPWFPEQAGAGALTPFTKGKCQVWVTSHRLLTCQSWNGDPVPLPRLVILIGRPVVILGQLALPQSGADGAL